MKSSMSGVIAALVVATVMAALLLIMYFVAKRRERGEDPHWAEEVYLYFDGADPSPDANKVASDFNASVATVSQVQVYLGAGGSAHGYGYAASGAASGAGARVVGAVPADAARGTLAVGVWGGATPPSPVGVWLYGAKPRRGTHGIAPFDCTHWFQTA